MPDLLSPSQIAARARMRREQLVGQSHGDSPSAWPLIVEGWSGDRQVFGFSPNYNHDLKGMIWLARSGLNTDTVVLFSDSRLFRPDMDDSEDRRIFQRFQSGAISLEELSKKGHPGVIDQLVILPFNVERGIFDPQVIRYLPTYTFGRETGIIWDVEDDSPSFLGEILSGTLPEALDQAMRMNGISPDGRLLADGESPSMWDALDADSFEKLTGTIISACSGRSVVLNAEPRITRAAGLPPESAPGRIAAGARSPEVVMQLVAREV